MARGIGLAGGFGAGGAQDALVDLIAQRMAEQQFEEQKRARTTNEALTMAAQTQREREATAGQEMDRSRLAENKRQFGESLGLDVRKFGEDVRQFDTDLDFKREESGRRQGETAREFGLRERGQTETERANRAREGLSREGMRGRAGTGTGTVTGGGRQRPIPALIAEEMATMETAQQMGRELVELGEEIEWAGVGGLGYGSGASFMAKNLGRGSPEAQSLRNYIGNIKGTIVKLKAGTAMTPQEQKLLETYVPTIDDNPMVIKQKIADLGKFIETKRAITLRIYGASAPPAGEGVIDDPREDAPGGGQQFDFDPKTGTLVPRGGG